METTTLDPNIVQAHTEAVVSASHRERLHAHLGRLAENHTRIDYASEDKESSSEESSLHTQAEMISHYFAESSSELGEDATEDEVWDKVFDKQMWELVSSDSKVDKEALAVNVLVGNLFASHGLPDQEAQSFLQRRMWSVASYRRGLTIVNAANKYIDLCVTTGQANKPFSSIFEQTMQHGALFMATDNSVDLKTVVIPIHELQKASPERQAWFIGVMAANKNFDCVNRNLPFIDDKELLLVEMIKSGRMSSDLLYNTPLGNDFSAENVIDRCIELGKNPTYYVDIENQPEALQSKLLNDMLATQPDSLAISMERFTKLPESDLVNLVESGFIAQYSFTNISAFKNLSAGMLQLVKEAGLNDTKIFQTFKSFDINDQKQYFDQMSDGFGSYVVFQYPEQIEFVDRETLIQLARDTSNMYAIGQNITKYTDGSDKELIGELINEYADSVARNINELPALDIEWFVTEIDKKDDFTALLQCLPYTDQIDHQKLFERILENDNARSILRYDIRLLTELDKNAVLDTLISNKLFDVITSRLDYFEGETRESIFARIADNPEALVAVADSIYLFPFVDRAWLIDSLAANGSFDQITGIADDAIKNGVDAEAIWQLIQESNTAVYKMMHRVDGEFCKAIGVNRVFTYLLEHEMFDDAAWQLEKIKDVELHQLFLDRCIEHRNAVAIKQSLDKTLLSKADIIKQLCQSGYEEPLVRWTDNPFFKDLPEGELPTQKDLLSWGAHATLLCNPDKYPDIDRNEHYKSLVDAKETNLIARVLLQPVVTSAPAFIAEYLVDSELPRILRTKKELFEPSVFTPELMEKYIASGDEAFIELYDYSGQKIDWVERGFAAFGKEVPPTILFAIRELEKASDEPLPAEFGELMVKQRGQGGVEQLKRAYSNIRKQLIHGTNTPEELNSFVSLATNNPIAKSIAKQLTRFTNSQWGKHGEDEWTRVLHDHIAASNEIEPLGTNFVPSTEYTIRTIDAKEFDPDKIDEDAANKFNALKQSLELSLEIADLPASQRFDLLFAESQKLIDTERERLASIKVGLQAQNKTKAVENIDRQLAAIDEVRQMSTKQFIAMTKNNFQQLTGLNIKGMDNFIRAGSFARAIKKSPEARSLAESIKGKDVSFENIVALDNFVEHLVNNEVYGDYFANSDARKAFIRNSDTTALRKQISKTQAGQTSGQTTLQFVPSRGPLLELSGHIGDACWASKYESIAKEFPNITAVAYLRNPGKNTERLVGAGLMIETTDQATGEDVVILRGTNPIENYINGVKVEDFFSALVSYAKSVAGDRRVAVVIDGGPGQATTNRPVLHTYLKDSVKGQLTETEPIKLPPSTTFNGYVLSSTGKNPHPVYYLH